MLLLKWVASVWIDTLLLPENQKFESQHQKYIPLPFAAI